MNDYTPLSISVRARGTVEQANTSDNDFHPTTGSLRVDGQVLLFGVLAFWRTMLFLLSVTRGSC